MIMYYVSSRESGPLASNSIGESKNFPERQYSLFRARIMNMKLRENIYVQTESFDSENPVTDSVL